MWINGLIAFAVLLVLALLFASQAVRITREYQRPVVFRTCIQI